MADEKQEKNAREIDEEEATCDNCDFICKPRPELGDAEDDAYCYGVCGEPVPTSLGRSACAVWKKGASHD